MNKLVCVTGMPGAGKSVVSDYFVNKGYAFIRFGQVVLDEIIAKKLLPSEENQRSVRERIRKEYGMAGIAKLNLPKLENDLMSGNVVVDNLISWSEYKLLKEKFKDALITIAVYSPPEIRYDRLSKRKPGENDKQLRNHHFSKKEAMARDFAEIENIEKGGPIVMADYTILNTGTLSAFKDQADAVFKEISNRKK